MKLRQTLAYAVDGYWDGGPKKVFDWSIERPYSNGFSSRIGSYAANHFFTVKTGETDKLTLSYAKQHLMRTTKIASTFEYIDD